MTIELLIEALLKGKGFADTNTALSAMEQKAKSASATAAAAIQQGPAKAVEELGQKAQTAGGLIAQGLGIDVGRRLMAGLEAIPRLMQNVAKEGIAFNETLESSRIGVAGVLRQFNPNEYTTFNAALEESGRAIDSLKLKALESPAKFGELVKSFQAVTGAATAARIPLQKQIDLVVLMSQTLAGLGIRSEQIIQESRALLTGNINEDAQAARILGITRGDIENAKAAGNLYEFLTDKMRGFSEAAKVGAQSLTTLRSNLGDAFEQTVGQLAEPLVAETKELFKNLTEAVKSEGFRAGLTSFFEGVRAVTVAVAAWAPFMAQHIGSIIAILEALGAAAVGVSAKILALKISGAALATGPLLAYAAGFAAIATSIRAAWEWLQKWQAEKQLKEREEASEAQVQSMRQAVMVQLQRAQLLGELSEERASELAAALDEAMQATTLAGRHSGVIDIAREVRLALPQSQTPEGFKAGPSFTKEEIEKQEELINEFNALYQQAFYNKEQLARTDRDNSLRRIDATIKDEEGAANARAQVEAVYQKRVADIRAEAFEEWDRQWDEMGEKIANHHRKAVQLEMQAAADRLRIERDEIALTKARVEADFRRTSIEKRSAILDLSRKEIEALDQVIATLKKKRDAESDDAAREAITGQITGLEGERRQAGINLAGMEGAASPGSFTDQFTRTMRDIREMWGGWAQEMAGAFQESFVGATNVISSNITGLIMMTQNWGQALQNISLGIMNSIVKAIVDMGVQWFMTHVFMRGVATATSALMRMLRRTETAETIAGEATKTPVLATNAAFATVSSWGAALATVALLAALVAGFAGAFADGGLIAGRGGPRDDMNFAAVSPGEFIVREAAVRKVGVPFLKAVNSGAAPGAAMSAMGSSGMGGGGGVHVAPAPVKVLVLNNRQEMMDALRSEAGRAAIVDAFNQSRVELGLPS